ncbi:MAG: cellulase family glycosylhydrolase [Myxococcota bacterium]|jgi:hypothetical protein|nr:cellulase family glycosylhydrolase [Myxococcota bacterium]
MESLLNRGLAMLVLCGATTFLGCEGSPPDLAELRAMSTSKVVPDRTYLRDDHGRYVTFNGVNVGGSTKLPYSFDPLTYIGRPFPLKEADAELGRIRSLGFNSIRLLWIWEAVEPAARGSYDGDFLDYFEKIIAKAKEHGLYVLVNLHENLFSRHLFVRYNENTDALYKSACRNEATGAPRWKAVCTVDGECEPGETCTKPKSSERNKLLDSILSVFPTWETIPDEQTPVDSAFSDRVQGDGAPLWAVKAVLPEKQLDARAWGVSKLLGNLVENGLALSELMSSFGGSADGPQIDVDKLGAIMLQAEAAGVMPSGIEQGTDMLPWSIWGLNAALSTDVQRGYTALFAGDKVFPSLRATTQHGKKVNIKEYLQGGLEGAWRQVAARAAKYDNVIGYDLMNEPLGAYIINAVYAALLQSGDLNMVRDLLVGFGGPDKGPAMADVVLGLDLLPPIPRKPKAPTEPVEPMLFDGESAEAYAARLAEYDAEKATYDDVLYPEYLARLAEWETQRDAVAARWGFADADLLAMAGMNIGFDKHCIQPLYERLSAAILEEDPEAVIWIEESLGINAVLGESGGNGWLERNMTRPKGVARLVLAPHWYPDIYPMLGFNMDPRQFTEEEWEYRDWTEVLKSKTHRAAYSLGNPPVVFGEFGTYFNFNGIDWSAENDYAVSQQILDNYYEAFDALGLGRMLWCYTSDNDRKYGDWWNHEDFSILDFDQKPRGQMAYDRPTALTTSGKPRSTHFYSDLHYYDPDKGEARPLREFEVEFGSKETSAPSEIHVPKIQYPQGFYVWLSDGYAVYDDADQRLYYFPTADEPGTVHKLTIRPPQNEQDIDDNKGWRYFFHGDQVVER